jgi:hypothetical protein
MFVGFCTSSATSVCSEVACVTEVQVPLLPSVQKSDKLFLMTNVLGGGKELFKGWMTMMKHGSLYTFQVCPTILR